MMRSAYFFVPGHPIPQGSKRAFRRGDRVMMVDVNEQALGLWRESIGRAARSARKMDHPLRVPLTISTQFQFPRPLGHFGKKGLLPSAPKAKSTKPDLDKLVRAVLDALTSVFYLDDAQVVEIHANKAYAEEPGVHITVEWAE